MQKEEILKMSNEEIIKWVENQKFEKRVKINGCSHCFDCSHCSHCSDCFDCFGCSHCSHCSHCAGCYGCSGCSHCSSCSNCYGCYWQKNSQYMICNVQFTEKEYKAKLLSLKK